VVEEPVAGVARAAEGSRAGVGLVEERMAGARLVAGSRAEVWLAGGSTAEEKLAGQLEVVWDRRTPHRTKAY
jgi:hypothetical protein